MMAAAGESKPDLDPQQFSPKKKTKTEKDAESAAQEQQNNLIISEIETSDGHIGTSLRTVYENDSEDKGQAFMRCLDSRIKEHDKEIEHMCNYHYQGFIDSVRSLFQVRDEVEKLKGEISTTNNGLQDSGSQLLEKGRKLVQGRKTQQNIESAIETLTICLPVLESYGKLKEQMRTKRYYPALKTLEQLEHSHLPRVSHYRFAQPMCQTIPQLRQNIKAAALADLKDFLENIRKHSERVGELAMKNAAEQNKMDSTVVIRRATPKKKAAPLPPNPFTGEVEKPKKKKAPPPPNPFTMEVDSEEDKQDKKEDVLARSLVNAEFEEGFSPHDLIDFAPVYRCLHIHTVLADREKFDSDFRQERRKQARLAIEPPHVMDRGRRLVQEKGSDPQPMETLEGYKQYFHAIVGFFIVEEHILNTTQGLVTRPYIEDLWEKVALPKIMAVLSTHIKFCPDADIMLNIKALIMIFCHSMKSYGLAVAQLYELILEVRDSYSSVLMKKWRGVFNDIFEQDNYTPLLVENRDQFAGVVAKFPFHESDFERKPFPKSFPFSSFVPMVYEQVKEYIYACLKFSEDLHLSFTEQEDNLNRFTNQFLEECCKESFLACIQKKHLTLPQLIQISVNMTYLEQACDYLEDFISNITGADKDSLYTSKLHGSSMFRDTRSIAEEQIYKQINNKINDFFELVEYDWDMEVPGLEPSDYIIDIVNFLRGNFQSFTNLPRQVAQTACMSACQHIAKVMLELLNDAQVRSVSLAALQQFSKDVEECEKFAGSSPVGGFNDGTLQMAFSELRQLLNLFNKWDWTTYVAEFGKEYNRYLRVKPEVCIILLEKIREGEKKKKNLLSNLRSKDADRKKLIDTLLGQLRQLSRVSTH